MKKQMVMAVILGVAQVWATSVQEQIRVGNSRSQSGEVSFRAPLVIPAVKRLECDATRAVVIDMNTRVTVACPDDAAADWVRAHFKTWFNITPRVVRAAAVTDGPSERYTIKADADGLAIAAPALAGVRHALQTLRQIVERDSSGVTVQRWRMPKLDITDEPALKFRGLHFCWFPEDTPTRIERFIRLAAAYKYNYVVLESWGVFRSEKHPWFGWPDGTMTTDVIAHLCEVAGDLGVTLIPQFNALGHAACARAITGKHATLDFAPEYQPLFEPWGGSPHPETVTANWNWCLSNPDAVRVVTDLIVELHDAFGRPPFFHLGGDEADKPTCASCRAGVYEETVSRHIIGLCELLRGRGARAMMWHDMLIRAGDPRWNGFYAYGWEKAEQLLKSLPSDLVICDWHYDQPHPAYPTLDYFSGTCKLDTLTCPWNNLDGIKSQVKCAREHGLFGMLETVWHHSKGENFADMVQTASRAAWGGDGGRNRSHFAIVWRQCGWDMGAKSYRETGWFDTQTTRDILSR